MEDKKNHDVDTNKVTDSRNIARKIDSWDMIVDMVSNIILPIAIFFTGYHFSEQERYMNLINMLTKYIVSGNEQERIAGMQLAAHFNKEEDLPNAIMLIIKDIADNAPIEVAKVANKAVNDMGEKKPELLKQIHKETPMRVYFHIKDESQREKAKQLAFKLKETSSLALKVPAIERLDFKLEKTELRFFKQKEKEEAEKLAAKLTELGVVVVTKDLSAKYENSKNIRDRHYELWLTDDYK